MSERTIEQLGIEMSNEATVDHSSLGYGHRTSETGKIGASADADEAGPGSLVSALA